MLGYELLLFMIKIETSTENRNKLHAITPCHSSISFGDHLFSTLGIIFGSGSFAIQVGDHLRGCLALGNVRFLGPVSRRSRRKSFRTLKAISKSQTFFICSGYQTLWLQGCFYSHSSRKQRLSITSYKKFQTCTALCFYTQINWKMAGISFWVVVQKAGHLPLLRGDEWTGIDRWTLSVLSTRQLWYDKTVINVTGNYKASQFPLRVTRNKKKKKHEFEKNVILSTSSSLSVGLKEEKSKLSET